MLVVREDLVTQAEAIAAQPAERVQWKTSSEQMRALLDAWKDQQRGRVRLDKDVAEAGLRPGSARRATASTRPGVPTSAELETSRAGARSTKEKLVAEAEAPVHQHRIAATAGAFWAAGWTSGARRACLAGRGRRPLWERFKSASGRLLRRWRSPRGGRGPGIPANLEVSRSAREAETLLSVTDVEAAKSALRGIQDRWERAGKVPRADIERTEKGCAGSRAIRDADERKWRRTNPEVASRAQSPPPQPEASVAKLEAQLADAEAKGSAGLQGTHRSSPRSAFGWTRPEAAG